MSAETHTTCPICGEGVTLDRYGTPRDSLGPHVHHASSYTREIDGLLDERKDLLEALRAAAAYVELYTANGCKEQPPSWAIQGNGDFDAEVIAERARAAIARAEGRI